MVQNILLLVTPSDHINIIGIGIMAESPPCFQDGLVLFSDQVKAQILDFVNNLNYGGKARLSNMSCLSQHMASTMRLFPFLLGILCVLMSLLIDS